MLASRIVQTFATAVVAASLSWAAQAQGYQEYGPGWQERRGQNYDVQAAPSGLGARLRTYPFSAALRARPIPGSQGAMMCALTTVDDDSSDGWCKVYFDEQFGEWMHQTGGTGGDNYCEATCMWIGPNADEEVRERPRFRRYER